MTARLETFNVSLDEALDARAKSLGELGKRMKGDRSTVVWPGPITPYHLIRGMESVPTTIWTPSTVSPQGARIHGCLIEDVDCDPDAALLTLLLGGIPGPAMLTEFRARVNQQGEASDILTGCEEFLSWLESAGPTRHPQSLLNIGLTMACQNWKRPEAPLDAACAIMRIMPILVGAVMRHCDGNGVHGWASKTWSTVGDFFGTYLDGDEPTDLQRAYLAKYLLLLLSHSTNLSSSTAHMVASGGGSADLVVSAGLTALWTPAHGGAQALIEAMLDDLIAFARLTPGDPMPDNAGIEAWVSDRVGNRHLSVDGVGHRVIKTQHDPRAIALRALATEHEELANDWRFQLLCRMMDAFPKIIPTAAPKITNPHVNVDFIAGPLQRMILGVKNPDNYVLLFALARYVDYLAAMILNGWLGGAIVRPDSVDETQMAALLGQPA